MRLNFELFHPVVVETATVISAIEITKENIVEIAKYIYLNYDYSVKIIDFAVVEYSSLDEGVDVTRYEARIGDMLELTDTGGIAGIATYTKRQYDKIRVSREEYNQKKG